MLEHTEVHISLYKESWGQIHVGLYKVLPDGQYSYINSDVFGPVDTTSDIVRWMIKELAPQLRPPLR